MNRKITPFLKLAVTVLKKAGAREVYLFGSAATGKMRKGSDVDLAISGLPPRPFFRVMGEVSDIFDRPVDIVDLDVPSLFSRYLKRKGKMIRVA